LIINIVIYDKNSFCHLRRGVSEKWSGKYQANADYSKPERFAIASAKNVSNPC
jgi:hypothetical protein